MYLMSYTPYEYVIEGILIPKKGYSQEQIQAGKKEVVELSDEDVAKLKKNKLFDELLTSKKVRLMETCPTWALTGEQRISQLEAELKKKSNKNTEKVLQEKEAILAEQTAALSDKDAEILALRERIATLEKGD